MTKTYCTIITANYLPYAQALLESLLNHSSDVVRLEVFISDIVHDRELFDSLESDQLHFNYINDISDPMAEKTRIKYHVASMDAYRWSMKPIFIKYLLEQKGYKKVIYLDSDLFFYNDPSFLFDLLNENRVILTPHWLSAENPELNYRHFKTNFTDGIYNAGFVGVSCDAIEIMDFWARMCYARCEINRQDGLYVDQKYLDILHSRFEGIGVVRHKGCNVSSWNVIDCKRILFEDGSVWIDSKFPIIFIHFSPYSIIDILNGYDGLLLSYFLQYNNTLQGYDTSLDLYTKYKLIIEKDEVRRNQKVSWIRKIRIKLRIRSRLINLLNS